MQRVEAELQQKLMWESTPSDAAEGEPEEVALLDALGGLLKMFEDDEQSDTREL